MSLSDDFNIIPSENDVKRWIANKIKKALSDFNSRRKENKKYKKPFFQRFIDECKK